MSSLKRRIATVELADERVLVVRIINPDVLRYEEQAHREKWPTMTVRDEVGTLPALDYSATFQAWAALKRTGQYDGSWTDFKTKDCVQVQIDEEELDPTPPDHVPDSWQSSPGTDDVPSRSSEDSTTST